MSDPARPRVLIIDDSRTIRHLLTSIHQELGYETFVAEDGVDALEKLRAHWPIQLATVDWEMPRMTGIEFMQAVRKLPEFDSMKLLMITTLNSLKQVAEGLRAGADEYLMKPVTRESLAEKLQLMGGLPPATLDNAIGQ